MKQRLSRTYLIALIALVQFVLQPLGANAWCMVREAAGHACCCVEVAEEASSCCSTESTQQGQQPAQDTCECAAAGDPLPATTPELPEWSEVLPIAAFAYELSPPLLVQRLAIQREREHPPRLGIPPRAQLQVFLL